MSTTDTCSGLGPLEFNTRLARKLGGLKKALGATMVRQNYRGTGSQAHRRQLWVRAPGLPGGYTDLWLDTSSIALGGISDLRVRPSLPYGDQTVNEVFDAVVQALKLVIAAEVFAAKE